MKKREELEDAMLDMENALGDLNYSIASMKQIHDRYYNESFEGISWQRKAFEKFENAKKIFEDLKKSQ